MKFSLSATLLTSLALSIGADFPKIESFAVNYGKREPEVGPAEITESPYLAQIRSSIDESLICSGAILNFLYILTSASCLENRASGDLKIVVGGSNLSENETSYSISEIILHENYAAVKNFTGDYRINDLAILKLASYLRYGKKIRPLRVPEIWENEVKIVAKSKAVVSGWGIHSGMNRVEQTIESFTDCRESYDILDLTIDESSHICASDSDGFKDRENHSEVGSPLVQDSKLIGLKSWPSISGRLDVYTNVYPFALWIEEKNVA